MVKYDSKNISSMEKVSSINILYIYDNAKIQNILILKNNMFKKKFSKYDHKIK